MEKSHCSSHGFGQKHATHIYDYTVHNGMPMLLMGGLQVCSCKLKHVDGQPAYQLSELSIVVSAD